LQNSRVRLRLPLGKNQERFVPGRKAQIEAILERAKDGTALSDDQKKINAQKVAEDLTKNKMKKPGTIEDYTPEDVLKSTGL